MRRSLVPFLGILILCFSACTQQEPAETRTPEEFADHVAQILISGTDFSFLPAHQEFEQDGAHMYIFPDQGEGWYYARSIVKVDGEQDAKAQFALSHSAGELTILLNGKAIYQQSTTKDGHFNHVDYGLFEWQHKQSVTLPAGTHELGIAFKGRNPGKQTIRLSFVEQSNSLTYKGITVVAPSEDEELQHDGYWWVGPINGKHDRKQFLKTGLTDRDLLAQEWSNRLRWNIPPKHLVKKLPGYLTYQNWHYSGGTFLDAMTLAQSHFTDLNYQAYIDEHLDFFLDHIGGIERMREDYDLIESPFGHYFRETLLDDLGMQTVPYTNRLLAQESWEKASAEYEMTERVVDYFMNDATRLPDGTYARYTPDTLSVWADDLFMGSILLLKMTELTGDQQYLEEVVKQVKQFDEHLLDPASKIYWHGWFSYTGDHSSTKWGRANGWTMMTKTELLQAMPADHPEREEILTIFRRHCEGLLAVQSNDGRWHQVLDDPDTYLETSATAMFLRAFAVGITEGWLDEATYSESLERGWAALTRQIDENGDVQGIVRGTPIMFSDQEYADWGTRRNDPRGLGALIYAAVAMDQYQNR
ncbi:MAG: glycoside hydrolase family 88 protein [Bacteroidota bacterium]